MRFTEPVTMLTDYLLAAASFAFAVAIQRSIGPRNRVSAWFWCAAFVTAAVAAMFGGTWHGFAAHLEVETRDTLWNLTMFAIGACGAFMTAGVHSAYIRRQDATLKWLVGGLSVSLVGGIVQQGQFMPRSSPFNHNDAYHLIQILGLYSLFRCARTVRDRPGVSADLALEMQTSEP